MERRYAHAGRFQLVPLAVVMGVGNVVFSDFCCWAALTTMLAVAKS